jgi:AraC-like DNA-binding protein
MPIKDGFELCFEIKSTEVTSHIPVLLLTAKADIESKLEGLKTGADYYLAKPFEPRELLTASTNLIAQRKKLRENFSKKLLLQPKEWEGASADERFLQKLMEFVEEKISEPDFSVEDMQQEMGISRMQLHRKLKALTDQSATEFIRTIRLKRAAEMLQKDFDNVSQVAYQVGFSSLSYFTKCFKEQYGALPSEFSTKNSTIS